MVGLAEEVPSSTYKKKSCSRRFSSALSLSPAATPLVPLRLCGIFNFFMPCPSVVMSGAFQWHQLSWLSFSHASAYAWSLPLGFSHRRAFLPLFPLAPAQSVISEKTTAAEEMLIVDYDDRLALYESQGLFGLAVAVKKTVVSCKKSCCGQWAIRKLKVVWLETIIKLYGAIKRLNFGIMSSPHRLNFDLVFYHIFS
jgi:hypothetical protein